MTDYFGKVMQHQDVVKALMAKIPGFSGYVERENRRDADKLLREKISREGEIQWQRISAVQRELLNQGGLAYMDDLEAASIKLRMFIDQVRNATYGYASLFDAVKVKEPELARLYEFDLSLLNLLDEVSRAIDNVEAAFGTEGIAAAISHLTSTANQCVETFRQRVDVITMTPNATSLTDAQSESAQ